MEATAFIEDEMRPSSPKRRVLLVVDFVVSVSSFKSTQKILEFACVPRQGSKFAIFSFV